MYRSRVASTSAGQREGDRSDRIQVFTKTPSQWREPAIPRRIATATFRQRVRTLPVSNIVAHDSYLINLASPDPELKCPFRGAFIAELGRCEAFGIPYLVSHPGNYMDSRDAGLARNAAAYTRSFGGARLARRSAGDTAGCGTALGSTFEELATLRASVGRRRAPPDRPLCRHLPPLFRGLRPDRATTTPCGRPWDDVLGWTFSSVSTSTTPRQDLHPGATGTS